MSMAFQDRFKGRISAIGKTGEIIAHPDSPTPHSPTGTVLAPPLPLADFHPRQTIESLQFVRPIRLRPPHAEQIPVKPADPSLVSTNSPRLSRILQQSEFKELTHNQSSPVITHKSAVPPGFSLALSPRPSIVSKNGELTPGVGVSAEKRVSLMLSERDLKTKSIGSSPTTEPSHRTKTEFKPYTLKDYYSIKGENYLEMGVFGPSTIGSEEWNRRKQFQDRRKAYAQIVLQSNSNQIAIAERRPKAKCESPPGTRLKALAFAKTVKPPRAREDGWDFKEEERKWMKDFAEEMKKKLLE